MLMSVRISLANKCQLLFGAAVLLILSAALGVGALRMQTLVREGQEETARKLAHAWLDDMIQLGGALASSQEPAPGDGRDRSLSLSLVRQNEFDQAVQRDAFLADAVSRFVARADHNELFRRVVGDEGRSYYRYARAIRESDLKQIHDGGPQPDDAIEGDLAIVNPLAMVLLIDLSADLAHQQLTMNRLYIVAAGLLAGLLAIGAFWFITTRIILSPVRVLRDTAEQIAKGGINVRSDINTGDEFQQLSDSFNTMLENLKTNQDQLRSINKSLDLKLNELAQSNVALYEANKVKDEFLANVSHELRTPLNSIIGFAEVLGESLYREGQPVDEKRQRYISHIIGSSRQLLGLINELLDLAKIEAGRMELHLTSVSIADTAEGLINLIRPLAEKRRIKLVLQVEPNLPAVKTDAGKFQQILFNFLSNAIKFTPQQGTVTLSARVLLEPDPDGSGNRSDHPRRVCVSVSDTGPGIAQDQHDRIFEKFTQLDSTVTREHSGTGLGLTISRELADLLQGHIELDSQAGHGAIFSLIIPVKLRSDATSLMPDESIDDDVQANEPLSA